MNSLNRRQFLHTSALGTAVIAQFPAIVGAADAARKLKLGLIGCGWYGMVDLKDAFRAGGVEVLALCDVDSDHLNASATEVEKLQGSRPKTFKHYEKLLETPGLEAVIIATPPHWHALQLIAALRHGLDVYCEKPLSYDVREGRAMVDAVKKSGRIVQLGFQRRKSAAFQAVRRHLQAGEAGRIVCCEANIHYNAGPKDATPQAPPASLDWDLWCGPAPKIPYSPQVGHMNWRLEKTTGHGHLVDWGIHLIDATRVILGEGMPKNVTAAGGLYELKGKITTPDVLTACFDFASCPVTWRHRIWGAEEYNPAVSNGIFFYGEKQTIFVTDDRWEIIPRGKGKDRQVQEAKSEAGLLHVTEFLNAVRERRPPGCLAEDAYASTTAVQLAMISYETGTRVDWDAKSERILNNPAATKLLKREYRKPYKHPFDGQGG
jgi:predicted dehydrogenase